MMPPSSFNLPPGCTPADIDRHFGGDDSYSYIVDVPGDLYFDPIGHCTIQSARRCAREVGGVVINADTNTVIYGHCSACAGDADNLHAGKCPACTKEAIDATATGAPEPEWARVARAWLRDIGAKAGLPFVGAALPTREQRLATLADSDTRAAYIDASTARIVAHTRRVMASATDESEDVKW